MQKSTGLLYLPGDHQGGFPRSVLRTPHVLTPAIPRRGKFACIICGSRGLCSRFPLKKKKSTGLLDLPLSEMEEAFPPKFVHITVAEYYLLTK